MHLLAVDHHPTCAEVVGEEEMHISGISEQLFHRIAHELISYCEMKVYSLVDVREKLFDGVGALLFNPLEVQIYFTVSACFS